MKAITKAKKQIEEFITSVSEEFRKDNIASQSAALSFYSIFSIIPIFILFMFIGRVLFKRLILEIALFENIKIFLGAPAMEMIERIVNDLVNTNQNIIVWIVAIVIIIYSSTKAFYFLQRSMNRIWNVNIEKKWFLEEIHKRVFSLLLIIILGILIISVMIINIIIAKLSTLLEQLSITIPTMFYGVYFLIGTSLLIIIIAAIYKYLPNVKLAWADVWMGALFTTIIFWIGYLLIGLFISTSTIGSIYGTVSSLLIFLLWVYYLAQAFYIGVEICKVRRNKNQIEKTIKTKKKHKKTT